MEFLELRLILYLVNNTELIASKFNNIYNKNIIKYQTYMLELKYLK